LEGSGHGLIEIFQYLLGDEENHEKPLRVPGVMAEIPTEPF
jgi:hypothetical protein